MDEYDRKLKELRTYVPFLTKMIDKLEKAGDKSKEAQLAKMRSLKSILTTTDKKLRLDTLIKCEDVLHKLYEKVEGVPLINTESPNQRPNPNLNNQRRDEPSLSSYLQQIHDNQNQNQRMPPNQHNQRMMHPNQNNQRMPPNPNSQQRDGEPSLSSYLQQIHDNQDNNRFRGRPNPWMNDPRPPEPWQQRPQFRPGFQEQQRPDPWGPGPRGHPGGRPPFQPRFNNPNFNPQERFRPPFDNNMRRPPFQDHQRPPFHGPGDQPRFQDHRGGQFRQERPPFWDRGRGDQRMPLHPDQHHPSHNDRPPFYGPGDQSRFQRPMGNCIILKLEKDFSELKRV